MSQSVEFLGLRGVGGGPSRKPHIDKKVRPQRRKRALRDRIYGKDFKVLALGRAGGDADATVVTVAAETPPTPKLRVARKGIAPFITKEERAFLYSRRLKPPQWRDASDDIRALHYHLALSSLGQVHTLNVNLRQDIIAAASASEEGFRSYMRERIARHLTKLGRPVAFWFVVEDLFIAETQEHRPHLHGEILLETHHKKETSKALRVAAGEWETFRQFQVKLKPSPDLDWPSYACKEAWKATSSMRELLADAGRRYDLSFKGRVMTATNNLKPIAEQVFEDHRAKLVARSSNQD
ncbi:hypothetical protein SAMN05519103_04015 [Rhizobiales bacterium GAS113]|nr:hypothetical protein SAMN05519103_04015 [Rhizobiales bacterium GAS113]